jgi:hypothetical protein
MLDLGVLASGSRLISALLHCAQGMWTSEPRCCRVLFVVMVRQADYCRLPGNNNNNNNNEPQKLDIATRLQENRKNWVQFPDGVRDFSLHHSFQAGPGTRQTS